MMSNWARSEPRSSKSASPSRAAPFAANGFVRSAPGREGDARADFERRTWPFIETYLSGHPEGETL
jgi:hypothetical protein